MAMLVITRGYWNCHYPIIPKAINQPVYVEINRGFLNTTRIEIRYTVCIRMRIWKTPSEMRNKSPQHPVFAASALTLTSLTILRFQHPIWLGHEQQHLWKSAWGPCEFCQGIHPVCQVESEWCGMATATAHGFHMGWAALGDQACALKLDLQSMPLGDLPLGTGWSPTALLGDGICWDYAGKGWQRCKELLTSPAEETALAAAAAWTFGWFQCQGESLVDLPLETLQ